jgi:hypothetical protein
MGWSELLQRERRDRQLRTRQLRNQVDKPRGDTYTQPPFAPFYPCTAGLTAADGGAAGTETGRRDDSGYLICFAGVGCAMMIHAHISVSPALVVACLRLTTHQDFH